MISWGDKVDILNLYGRYVFTLDSGDGKAWSECFTEDGVFLRPHGSDVAGVLATRTTGRADLAKLCETAYAEGKGRRRRWGGNAEIWGGATSNEAEGRASFILFLASGPGPAEIAASGMYKDRLRKTKAGWLFQERALILDVGSEKV